MDFTIDADATIFQFTPLREGRPCPDKGPSFPALFQFTPLREGRREQELHHVATLQFQFTPLREGRQLCRDENERRKYISIHAPPRGATCAARRAKSPASFQFTPLREGRQSSTTCLLACGYFNSRPSARGDATGYIGQGDKSISIHAPPRGATSLLKNVTSPLQISIHAPPRGATAKDMQFLQIFCSTLTNQHGLTIVPRNLSRLFW